VDGNKPRKLKGVSPEQMAKMEREISNLQGQYKLVEHYGQDVLDLVLAKGFLAKLPENQSVRQHLRQHQPDLLTAFQAIVEHPPSASSKSWLPHKRSIDEIIRWEQDRIRVVFQSQK
jgi:hypothetical protein